MRAEFILPIFSEATAREPRSLFLPYARKPPTAATGGLPVLTGRRRRAEGVHLRAHQGLSPATPPLTVNTLMFPPETKLHWAGNTLLSTLGNQDDHPIGGRDQNVTLGGGPCIVLLVPRADLLGAPVAHRRVLPVPGVPEEKSLGRSGGTITGPGVPGPWG